MRECTNCQLPDVQLMRQHTRLRLFAMILRCTRQAVLIPRMQFTLRYEGKGVKGKKAITRLRALMGKIHVITPSARRRKNSPWHRLCSKCGARTQTCLSLRARWMISHIKTGCWNCDSGKGKIKCLFTARFRRARATFLTFRYCTPISLQIKAATAKRLIITEIESFVRELGREKFYNSLCNYESGKNRESGSLSVVTSADNVTPWCL